MVPVFEKSNFQTIFHVTDFCNILQHIVKLKLLRSLKHRRDHRLKYMFMCNVFIGSFFYLPFKHNIIYNGVKLYHQIEVFTPEYLNVNSNLHEAFLSSQFTVLTISKITQINNKSFYCLLIIHSGI